MGILIIVLIYDRIQSLRHAEKMKKLQQSRKKLKPIKEREYDEIPNKHNEWDYLFEHDKRKGNR